MSDIKSVYTIMNGAGNKAMWVRIGRAFVNRDGSINVQLDALPVNGTMQLRDDKPAATTGDKLLPRGPYYCDKD